MKEIIKKIDESIDLINKEIEEKKQMIGNLNKSKETLFILNDICNQCYGDGEIFIPGNDMDPYHKSSNDWFVCPKCNGTKKYIK